MANFSDLFSNFIFANLTPLSPLVNNVLNFSPLPVYPYLFLSVIFCIWSLFKKQPEAVLCPLSLTRLCCIITV